MLQRRGLVYSFELFADIAAKNQPLNRDAMFKECMFELDCGTDSSRHCGDVGMGSMVDGLPRLCGPRITSRCQRSKTKAL